jgi:hypothetical protein
MSPILLRTNLFRGFNGQILKSRGRRRARGRVSTSDFGFNYDLPWDEEDYVHRHATIRVADRTDVSGRVTADEVNLDRFRNRFGKVCALVAARSKVYLSAATMILIVTLAVPLSRRLLSVVRYKDTKSAHHLLQTQHRPLAAPRELPPTLVNSHSPMNLR